MADSEGTYDSRREAVEGTLSEAKGSGQNLWKTPADKERLKEYDENWNLFLGKHYVGDGGPWAHPYGVKGIEENIPYQILNLLGKASRAFADLLYGDGIEIKSSKNSDFFSKIGTKQLWSAFILASAFGFCGLQPEESSGKWSVSVVRPEFLFPEFSPSNPNRMVRLYKRVPFLGVQSVQGRKIDVLYEEAHFVNRVETRVFEIKGDSKVKELPLDFYKESIDPDCTAVPLWIHGLGNYFITVLFNERITNQILSDYTVAAKRGQESLNDQKTQIARILKLHSNPKLLAPRGAFTQDAERGTWEWMNQNSEVLINDPNDPNAYRYLTWDGQIAAAVESRDDQILSLCTELDMAPQLLSMPKLVGGTVAETASKLKQLMHATIKKAERKREWSWLAIEKVVKNITRLAGREADENDFTVNFSELIPRSREEKIDEAIARKNSNLITTEDALELMDGLSKEEAQKKAIAIHIESSQSVVNPYRSSEPVPEKYFPEVKAEVPSPPEVMGNE